MRLLLSSAFGIGEAAVRNRSLLAKPLATTSETDLDRRFFSCTSWVIVGQKGALSLSPFERNGLVTMGRLATGNMVLHARKTNVKRSCIEIQENDIRFFRGAPVRDGKSVPGSHTWSAGLLNSGDQL